MPVIKIVAGTAVLVALGLFGYGIGKKLHARTGTVVGGAAETVESLWAGV
jgi:hypothetical protein